MSTMRRRLTPNPANAGNSIRALKRAIDLASFIAPTAIHLHGDNDTEDQEVYLSQAMHKHIKKLYDSLRKGESALSREKFQQFLENRQGETAPKLTEEKYKFHKFLEVWWLYFGLDAERPVHFSEKDLTKPISNYFISSSHNTYLSGSQVTGRSSAEAYRRVLRKNCRCIEIDVWDPDSPSSSPERSRSHSQSKGGFKDHSRGPSGGSFHTVAANLKETVEHRIEQTRHMLGVEKSHSHSPKCSKGDLAAPPSRRDVRSRRGPSAIADSPQSERSLSRSRSPLPSGEPIVMHGYTFTHPVGFREVCQAVREAAFEKSSLPLIVSLEVHADPEQQEVMVQIMKQEWGELLVDKPSEQCPSGRMPTLEELQNKILVKVKRASSKPEGTSSTLSPYSIIVDDEGTGSDDDRPTSSNGKKRRVPICESLSALAIHTHSEHFETFESTAAKTPSHIFSISEKKILELHETKNREMFAHNRHYFMRAYPNGYRFDSSNLDPSLFWRKGVQMVAMNWQSCDEGMMLNEAMFSGEHGWVLKPPGYRSEDKSNTQEDAIPHRTLTLSIRVLAGQHIPLPESVSDGETKKFRPLVKCELHVEKPEERSGAFIEGGGRIHEGEYKQKTTASKTNHPDFGTSIPGANDNNLLEFRNVPNVVEQLSFVRFEIKDDAPRLRSINRDPLAGWACIRLDRLMSGYRFIKLFDAKGNETSGCLLVSIIKQFQ